MGLVVCPLQDAIHVCHELHNAIVFEVVQRCSDSGLWACLQQSESYPKGGEGRRFLIATCAQLGGSQRFLRPVIIRLFPGRTSNESNGLVQERHGDRWAGPHLAGFGAIA